MAQDSTNLHGDLNYSTGSPTSAVTPSGISPASTMAAVGQAGISKIATLVNGQLTDWSNNNSQFGDNVSAANSMYNSTEDENTANMTSAGSSQLGGSGSQDMGQQMMQQMSQMGQQFMQPLSMLGEMLGEVAEPLEEGLQQVMQMAQQGGMGQQNPEQQQDQQQAGGAGGADGKHDGKDKGKGDLNDRVDKLEERTGKLEAESPVHHGIQSGAQGGPAQQGAAPMGGGVGGAMPRHAQSGQRGSIPVNPLEGPPAEGGHVEFNPQDL